MESFPAFKRFMERVREWKLEFRVPNRISSFSTNTPSALVQWMAATVHDASIPLTTSTSTNMVKLTIEDFKNTNP